jgi:hypothetical protein
MTLAKNQRASSGQKKRKERLATPPRSPASELALKIVAAENKKAAAQDSRRKATTKPPSRKSMLVDFNKGHEGTPVALTTLNRRVIEIKDGQSAATRKQRGGQSVSRVLFETEEKYLGDQVDEMNGWGIAVRKEEVCNMARDLIKYRISSGKDDST